MQNKSQNIYFLVEIKQGIAEKLQTNLHPEFCLID
jgi:hypothetical protein